MATPPAATAPQEASLSLCLPQLHAVTPAAMLSAILCLKDQKSSSSTPWLLHSMSSSPCKAVLLRHHRGSTWCPAPGFCSKASCRHRS